MPANLRLRKDDRVARRTWRTSRQLFSIPDENITVKIFELKKKTCERVMRKGSLPVGMETVIGLNYYLHRDRSLKDAPRGKQQPKFFFFLKKKKIMLFAFAGREVEGEKCQQLPSTCLVTRFNRRDRHEVASSCGRARGRFTTDLTVVCVLEETRRL